MPSAEHTALSTRISELAKRFVDFDIPLDRDPSAFELDMIASFKLLAHAEFETFIETRIRETIKQGIETWKVDKRVTRALFGLLLRWYPYFEQDKNPFASPQTLASVTDLIELLERKAERELDENNGIKKEAFSRLCHSVGILLDDLSPVFLAAVESYGKNRGDIAHNAVGKVRTLNDPRVEVSDALQIVGFLDQFDQQLTIAAA